MHTSACLRAGALLGGLAVALGAFAAHGMKQQHYDDAALQTFDTGVRYQMFHALALLGCAALQRTGHRTGGAALCFVFGTVLFSGSLYGLVLLQAKWLGPVTPVGGVLFVLGWLWLLLSARNADDEAPTAGTTPARE